MKPKFESFQVNTISTLERNRIQQMSGNSVNECTFTCNLDGKGNLNGCHDSGDPYHTMTIFPRMENPNQNLQWKVRGNLNEENSQ